jgi:hypothetical protein
MIFEELRERYHLVIVTSLLVVALFAAVGCQGCDDDASPSPDASTVQSDVDTGGEADVPGHVDAFDTRPEDSDVRDTRVDQDTDDSGSSSDADATHDSAALGAAVQYPCDASTPDADTDAGANTSACRAQDPGSFGDCATSIGVVFDGTGCVAVSGCPCDGEDCPAFDTLEECAKSCGAEGWCQMDRAPVLHPYQPERTVCADWNCQAEGTGVCVSATTNPEQRMRDITSYLSVQCFDSIDICAATVRVPRGANCVDGDWCCVFSGGQNKGFREDFCRVSLLPDVRQGGCMWLE